MEMLDKPIAKLRKVPVIIDDYGAHLKKFILSKERRISAVAVREKLGLKKSTFEKKINGFEKFTEEEKRLIRDCWRFDFN